MSFRKFGGLKYSAKHNSVSSYYNTSNNLQATTIGQPNTYINVESELIGNFTTNTAPSNAWIQEAIQSAVQEAVPPAVQAAVQVAVQVAVQAAVQAALKIWNPNSTFTLVGGATGVIDIKGMLSQDLYSNIQPLNNIVSISLGTDVTGISYAAFQNLTSLESITLPKFVTSVGDYMFLNVPKLTSITVDSDNINYSSDSNGILFNKSKTLLIAYPAGRIEGSYTIPNTVRTIGSGAFNAATYLKSLTIPISVISLGQCIVTNAAIQTIIFTPGSQLTSIRDSAFLGASGLISITIPSSVQSIGAYSFLSTISLLSITIPSSVTSIGASAFQNATSLKSITIPALVTSIGLNAFANTTSLTAITVDLNNSSYFSDISGILFNKNKNTLIQYPAGNTQTSYTILESVTRIGANAFQNATYLTSIIFATSSLLASIEANAFQDTTRLTSIEIPTSVTSIGSDAFLDSGLKTVVFKSSINLASLGFTTGSNKTFFGATGVTISLATIFTLVDQTTKSIDIQGALTVPSGIAVNNIKLVSIGTSITSIDANVFQGASSLASITVDPNNNYLSDISGILFNKDKTTLIQYPSGKTTISFTIPASVTSIGASAFQNAINLTSIIFATGSQLISIGSNAFNATSITSINIPNTVTSIGAGAFSRAINLASIIIPSSVINIGLNAFNIGTDILSSLTSINVDAGNINYSSDGGVLFNKDKTTLIQYPNGNYNTSYTVPNTVKSIGENAFQGANKLLSVTMPASVNSINITAFSSSGLTTVIFNIINNLTSLGLSVGSNKTFFGATGVTISVYTEPILYPPSGIYPMNLDMTTPEQLTTFTLVGGTTQTRDIVGDISDSSYSGIPKNDIVSVSVGTHVTSIGLLGFGGAFQNALGLKTVTFKPGSKVTSIGVNAFFSATSLESISLPNTVTSIGENAFGFTTSLQSITVDPNNAYSSDSYGALFNNTKTILIKYPVGNTRTSYTVPNTVISIGASAFNTANKLTSVSFAAGSQLTSIGVSAFQTATSLLSITLPNTVTNIGESAFQSTTNLQSINVPASVESIGDYALYGATKLISVTFAANSKLTSIGHSVFNTATSLQSIEVPASVTSIGESAFLNSDNLETVTFATGSKLTSIGVSAFSFVSKLKTIEIPSTVTTIGASAFQNTTKLLSINVPTLVTSIGDYAFSASGITNVIFQSSSNLATLGATIGSGKIFFRSGPVTISSLDYVAKTPVTNYYYPGVNSSPISLDTTGYTRCDVLIVGHGGNAGTVTYSNYGSGAEVPIFDLGGAGGGGGSASFTNITCNPLGGNIQFAITPSGSSWVLNNWVKDGTPLGCQLTAGNGGNGVSPLSVIGVTMPVTGGTGGISSGSSTGLPSGVVLTTNTGALGSTGIYGWSPPTPSSYPPLPANYPYPLENYNLGLPTGGNTGTILTTRFTPPLSQNNNNMGHGSGYQQISSAFNVTIFGPSYPFTIFAQNSGAAYIQVNRYN